LISFVIEKVGYRKIVGSFGKIVPNHLLGDWPLLSIQIWRSTDFTLLKWLEHPSCSRKFDSLVKSEQKDLKTEVSILGLGVYAPFDNWTASQEYFGSSDNGEIY